MALARFVTRGMGNKISGQTLSWNVHLDAAQMGLDGRLVPTQERIEFIASAKALSSGERERLMGVFATYRAGNQTPGISNVAQVTLKGSTFMGATQEEWGGAVLGDAASAGDGRVPLLHHPPRKIRADGAALRFTSPRQDESPAHGDIACAGDFLASRGGG